MIDTHLRKHADPLFEKIANIFIKYKVRPNTITLVSFILGLASAIAILFKNFTLSFIFLWLSGLFDVIDGIVARKTSTQSMLGAQLDIVSDRVVEICFICAIALINDMVLYHIIFLLSMILISITIFLTTGMITKNKTKKSFYYQSGLMERTEGFIMFSLMLIFYKYVDIIILIYGFLILITIIQRLTETYQLNKGDDDEDDAKN